MPIEKYLERFVFVLLPVLNRLNPPNIDILKILIQRLKSNLTLVKKCIYRYGIKKNTNKEQIALDLLNLFKIEELKNKFPHQISGGEKQRVALARSMAPNPNFIMLDEAFSALDYDLKVSIYDEVLEIFQGKNITVILVTHDAEEAKILSTRQLNMNNGELL